MANAIRVHNTGGPEALRYDEIDIGRPGSGEVRLRHTAVGVNFIDVYFRTGLYKSPSAAPFTLGMEGAGVVEEIGPDVAGLKVGDRVAYADPIGSYATERLAPAARLVRLPDAINEETAASVMLKGMTARYLLRETFPLKAGQIALVHAAAGGVGLILCQWAAHIGATVIGTVGSEEMAALAAANGCTHTILYRSENFVDRVAEITNGEKCHVVYDSVGKDTFPGSLDCLRPRGLWATFGQSSGALPDLNMGMLAQRGSLFATRPSIYSYIASRDELAETADDLFATIASGAIRIGEGSRFALKDAADAHRALEGRGTSGSTILVP